MSFQELEVSKEIEKGLNELGIQVPTKIQSAAIPVLSKQKTDFIGQAQTGTGKAAAYGLPILSRIDPKKEYVEALILATTRELGQQLARQSFKFTKYACQVLPEAVYGAEKIDSQIARLNRPTHIVVATPGRLFDPINKKAVHISRVETLVLDEADEML